MKKITSASGLARVGRRAVLKLSAAAALGTALPAGAAAVTEWSGRAHEDAIPQWGLFEIAMQGPSTGNPFVDVEVGAEFTVEHRTVKVKGFYDGDGVYRVRFMPDMVGSWSYRTTSSVCALDGHTGAFACTAPGAGNHGPVGTAHQFHFEHADGRPFFPLGTTTYAFLFTAEDHAQASIEGMRGNFNKSRVCVLPKPLGEGPKLLPFPTTDGNPPNDMGSNNDYTRFVPAYFQLMERRLLAMQQEGVQADCILFHPYAAWGYKYMPPDACDRWLRYVVARFAAHRHVWWSIANEFDLLKTRTMADWDRYFRIVEAEDPYSHLRSIHHSKIFYDYSKPWCTHASLQRYDFDQTAVRRLAWNKPIIYDEIQYEGDIPRRWGNLSAEEMTYRFWRAVGNGAYASHGEVFLAPESGPHAHEPSWSDAGRLRGYSAPRILFLRKLLERITRRGLDEVDGSYYLSAADGKDVLLYFFDYHRPALYDFPLPTSGSYSATLIDPFAMTEHKLPGVYSGKSKIVLQDAPYRAVLFEKAPNAASAALPHTTG